MPDPKDKKALLLNLTPEVLAEMSSLKDPQNMSDREKVVRSIYHFCPEDQDNLNELIEISTDPMEKGTLQLKSGKYVSFGKHVDECFEEDRTFEKIDFAPIFTLDQCEQLEHQVELSKPLRRTLAVALDRLGSPTKAFDHMLHCPELMKAAEKEAIMIKAIKELQDKVKELPAGIRVAPAAAPGLAPWEAFTGSSWQEFMKFRYEQHRQNPVGPMPTKKDLGQEWEDLKAKRGLTEHTD